MVPDSFNLEDKSNFQKFLGNFRQDTTIQNEIKNPSETELTEDNPFYRFKEDATKSLLGKRSCPE